MQNRQTSENADEPTLSAMEKMKARTGGGGRDNTREHDLVQKGAEGKNSKPLSWKVKMAKNKKKVKEAFGMTSGVSPII